MFCTFLQHSDPFIYCEHRLFAAVLQHSDDQLIHQGSASFGDIQMAKRHGIKTAWINSYAHVYLLSTMSGSLPRKKVSREIP